MKDCWWNERAESGKDTASPETPITPAENTKTETSITGILTQSEEGDTVPANLAQWLYSVTKREKSREEFLIDSGAATSVCQRSLGGKPRGQGVELRSSTGHQFTATRNTTICLRTRDGVNVAGTAEMNHIRWTNVRQRQHHHVPQHRWNDTQRVHWKPH